MSSISNIPIELTIIIVCILAVIAVISFVAIGIARTARKQLKQKKIDFATINSQNKSQEDQITELKSQLAEFNLMIEQKTKAISEKDSAIHRSNEMQEERDRANAAKAEAESFTDEAESKVSLANMQLDEMQKRMSDWEKHKEDMSKAAHHSVLEAGQKMSSKLLEDHKREAEATKKQQTEQVQQTTNKLMKQFDEISKYVSQIDGKSDSTGKQMEVVMRALTNPTGVGQMAEVGLENLLKNFGLVAGQDFIMQYHIADDNKSGNAGLRPDAVVFLPQDLVIVIDSKASKHLIEISENHDNDDAEKSLAALQKTMNEHLRALSSKDYKSAIIKHIKSNENVGSRNIGNILNVMYVPSESTVEKIFEADKNFHDKLIKSDIILASPSGLFSIFQLAKEQIAASNRDKNNEVIIDTVKGLIESVATAFTHIDKVGGSLKSSMEHFEKFARSTNRNILPKARKLAALGVEPAKNKQLPTSLATYDIRKIEDTITLEAETSDDEKVTPIIKSIEEA